MDDAEPLRRQGKPLLVVAAVAPKRQGKSQPLRRTPLQRMQEPLPLTTAAAPHIQRHAHVHEASNVTQHLFLSRPLARLSLLLPQAKRTRAHSLPLHARDFAQGRRVFNQVVYERRRLLMEVPQNVQTEVCSAIAKQ